MYSDSVSRPRALRARHSVENQWDLLGPLGIEPPDPSRDPVEMSERAEARDYVERTLAAAGVAPGAEVLVVHVSAGNPFRRWPAASFVEAATRLVSADTKRHVVFTSGPSDAGAARSIAAATRGRLGADLANRIVLCDEFDLTQLRSLIGRAAVYIGGDSGPLHIAASTDTPIVGIFGPTLPARSAPWRSRRLVSEVVEPGPLPCRPCNQRRCMPGDFRCLTSVTPETVVAAAERAMRRGRRTDAAQTQPTLA
jgi:ADP-heptose:LPS heptosyltransferase